MKLSIGAFKYAGVVDTHAMPSNLENYGFKAVSTNAVFTGIFVDSSGRQTGVPVTATVTSAVSRTLAQIAGGTLPSNAVGFICNITQEVYVSMDANSDNSYEFTGPGVNCPTIVTGKNYRFGRIAQS